MTEATRPQAETDSKEPYSEHTPAMRQYLILRDKHPGVMLLYRIGDFYETFFDDAVKINRLIGLTLTKRGTFQGKPIPMAGIPAATLEQYLARLVKLGVSVAICEQIGDPNEPGKATMDRKIVRIVTPGTLTDNALLSEKSDSVLLAVARIGRSATANLGLVWLTLTNGRFCAASIAPQNLATELARITPSEILVPAELRETVQGTAAETAVNEMPAWYFDAERGRELLKKQFGLNNLEAWGIENEPAVLSACNALLSYVANTQCDSLPYIAPLELQKESNFIVLDAASRRNLEITESLRNDNGPTLFSVMDNCFSSMGSRELKNWLTTPSRDTTTAKKRHEAVAELMVNLDALEPLKALLCAMPDIERTAGRIALKSIRPKEAAALRDYLPSLKTLKAVVSALQAPIFAELARALEVDDALYEKLKAMLLDEPATFLREGDVIRSEADPELTQLRSMRDHAGDLLLAMEAREKERTGIATLRIDYNRVSGYFIEVPKGQSENVPADFRRRQTLKNTERYITPELKQYEDQRISAKERASQIERALWDELVTYMHGWVEVLLAAAHAAAALDVLLGFARHAFEMRWTRPQLMSAPGIDITGARHPVVEKMIDGYIPNNCSLVPGRRLLIITGPNMGGKSTYMRSVALIVLLAYAGSFVPAAASQIGPVDKILTRIGASDDLARGRSTFMVEMTEAASILMQATEESLVLMDEIGRGTSTFDGLSLAGAIAEELAEGTRSWTLFATHYFELTQLAQKCREAVNVHVSAENTSKGIVFLHDVKDGPASQSYGIAVASLAGIPARVIRRAKALLKKLEERAKEDTGPQLDLFAAATEGADTEEDFTEEMSAVDPAVTAFVDEVAAIDIDSLSPRDAMNKLYELTEKAKSLG